MSPWDTWGRETSHGKGRAGWCEIWEARLEFQDTDSDFRFFLDLSSPKGMSLAQFLATVRGLWNQSRHSSRQELMHSTVFSFSLRACVLSLVRLLATHQVRLSLEFSRQEYWSRLPFSSSRGPSYPGIKPVSLVSPAWLADSLPQPTWFKRVSMCSFSVEQVRQVIIDPRLDKTHLGLHGHHTGGKTQTRTHAFKSIIQEGVQGSLGPNTSPPRPGGPRIH